MRSTIKFIIQIAIILFVGWFLVKFTTFDDKLISFFRANSNLTGNLAVHSDVPLWQGAECVTPWGETLGDGAYIIAYESVDSCRFEKRYCTNGTLEGSFTADHCNSPEGYTEVVRTVVRPEVTKISYGYVQGVEQAAYQPSTTNAKGTVTIVGSWNNNKTNPTTVSANDSLYSNPKNWNYRNYDLTQRGCTTPWWTFLSDGSSVIAYKSSTPSRYGASCTYERRTCFNGTLGGSYRSKTCSTANNYNIYDNNGQDYYWPTPVHNYSCVTPWGQTVSNGARVYAYRNSSASYGSSCVGEYRTCMNGYLNGSYSYSSCNYIDTHNDCDDGHCGGHDYGRSCSLPRGGSIADGSSVTAYSTSTAPCTSQTRTCNNGYLNGSYSYSSCTTPTNYDCSLPWWGKIHNGEKVEAYQNSTAPCYKEVRTCNYGVLGGSFQYSSCTTTTDNGGSDTYGTWQDAGSKEGNIDSLDTCNNNATSPFTCGSASNNSCTDYQKLSCTSFSPMICSYQTRSVSCVK